MAKKKTTKNIQPNKSAAIVEQVKKNPEAGNAEIAAELNAQYGWNISTGYVSTIKSTKGLTKGRSRKAKKAVSGTVKRVGRPKTATASELSFSQLQDAKEFAERVGGVEQARKTLDALAELQG